MFWWVLSFRLLVLSSHWQDVSVSLYSLCELGKDFWLLHFFFISLQKIKSHFVKMANSQKDVSGQKTKRYRPKKNVQEKTKLKIVTPRYSARKNLTVTGNSKSSSQKKKPKKSKVFPATESSSDYYDDDDAQSIFQSSVQVLFSSSITQFHESPISILLI